MLAHQLGNPERTQLYAQQVSREADRLGRVVANMLEFTRLERGSLTVKPEPGDLGGAVRECVEQLRPALEVAGCSIKLSVAGDLPSVAFDRDAVHHIVQNLLDNAEKYSRPSSDRSVDVEVARMNGHAAVIVSDRGAGIDARVARHLFLPFERGANGDAPAGLGLGLVLVKALAEAHGGDVSWSVRSGGGTTFRVRLPAFYTA
jgi:signal transduction histidine kinase